LGFPRLRTLEALEALVGLLLSHPVYQSHLSSLCSPALWHAALVRAPEEALSFPTVPPPETDSSLRCAAQDIFFGFMWNNIAQNVVATTLKTIFNTAGLTQVKLTVSLFPRACPFAFCPNPTCRQILRDARLLERIVEAHAGNEEDLRTEGGRRRGYMGAITQISSALLDCVVADEDLQPLVKGTHPCTQYTTHD
jgi:hypothetical protein